MYRARRMELEGFTKCQIVGLPFSTKQLFSPRLTSILYLQFPTHNSTELKRRNLNF